MHQASFSRYNEFEPAAQSQIELLDSSPTSGTCGAEGVVTTDASGKKAIVFQHGGVVLDVGGKVSETYQLYVSGVPIYISAELGNKFSFDLSLMTDPENGLALIPSGTLLKMEISPSLKLGVGLDLDSIATAGVYGKAVSTLGAQIPFVRRIPTVSS